MATSGTSSWNPTITAIINMAYRKLGVIAEDETPTAGQYNDALFAANAMIKEWHATGIHVWTEEEAILFLQAGQYQYALGGTTTDNCCDVNSYVLAQLANPAAQGATSVSLTNTSALNGFALANGFYFGVTLDSGAAFWTTISGTPSGGVVNLASPLPGSASAQNFAFGYQTQIVRPLKVPGTRLFYYQGLREVPMTVLSRKEYMDLPQKANLGTPTQFFYTPQLVSGLFYIWPNPQNASWGARLTWYRPLMDLTTPANTVDFPQEWVNAIGWNLAREMGPEYDVPPQRWTIILSEAEKKLELAQNFDRETEPIYFGMAYDEAQR